MNSLTYLIFCVIYVLFLQTELWRTSEVPFKVMLNEKGQFIDTFGRVRLFRGFNSVMKKIPWYDHQILNETRLKYYRDWGFNVVRLGCMWAGLQPSEASLNGSYINILLGMVRKLESFGLYSLLDMHQDVLSSAFESYDGIPRWLFDKFPSVPEIFKFPFPLSAKSSHFWADYYITYAASDAFQQLYTNEIGLKSWENIWSKIGSIFSKEVSVIGYELFNEPWVGNFYKNLLVLLPGYAGKYNLLPAYDRLVAKIRKVDNNTLVFYEPVTFGSYFPTFRDFGTGFDRVPGGVDQKLKSVLSYHFYCFFLFNANGTRNYNPWMRFVCDNVFAKELFKSVQKNVKATGGGSFLTEFGGCVPDGNSKSINTIECNAVIQLADEHYQSYTYWDSQHFNDDGSVNTEVAKTFARAYPRALQGQPLTYSFNTTSATINLVYTINLEIRAPTEIFLPMTVHYISGFRNETNPPMVTRFDASNSLFIISPPQNLKQGTQVSVKIYP